MISQSIDGITRFGDSSGVRWYDEIGTRKGHDDPKGNGKGEGMDGFFFFY